MPGHAGGDQLFHRKVHNFLHNKGLPSPLGSNDRLMRHVDYSHKLSKYAIDQITSSTSASEVKALPSGQALYHNLENLFYIEHEVKHLFTIPPSFFRYTETNQTLRKLQRCKLRELERWQSMLEIL